MKQFCPTPIVIIFSTATLKDVHFTPNLIKVKVINVVLLI